MAAEHADAAQAPPTGHVPAGLSEKRLQFARDLADPDWCLSVPQQAKAVISDLLTEVERLSAALRDAQDAARSLDARRDAVAPLTTALTVAEPDTSPPDCNYCGLDHPSGTACPPLEHPGTEWDQ